MRVHCRRIGSSFFQRHAPVGTRALSFIVCSVLCSILVWTGPAQADRSIGDFFLPTGDNPQSLSAADCDGNGAMDLLAANFSDDTVTVYLNEGSGVFGPAQTIATPPSPAGAACDDLTGDGLFDVVVSSFVDGSLTIYAGQEVGGFIELGTFDVGEGPRSVSIVDFDTSGSLDVVVVNSRSDNISVLFGDGAGNFPFEATTVNLDGLNQSNAPFSGFVSNYDDNALPDLAIVSQGRPSLHILLNSGAGLSQEPMPQLPRSRGLAGADINDDGLADLAVLSTESVVRILLGTDTGSFVVDEAVLVHPSARAVAVADFNEDDLVDIAVAYNEDNTIQIIPATAPGRFANVGAVLASESHNPLAVLAARSTAGSDQLVLADGDTRSVSLLEADGAGAISPTLLRSTANAPQALILADMTGDGLLDAVTVVKVGRDVTFEILPGTSEDSFAAALAGPGLECGDGVTEGAELCDDGNTKSRDGCSRNCNPEIGRGVLSMDAADINGDDHTDLVIVDRRRELLVLLGDGAARFSGVLKLGKVRSKTTAQVGDFDGNDTPDIGYLPSSRRDGAVAVLFNDGLGNFERVAVVPTGRFTGPVLSGDIDGNGTLDMVVMAARRPRGLMTLLNDGAGPERVSELRKVERRINSLVAADFDEDGRLDLLAQFKKKRQLPLVMLGIGAGEFAPGAPASPNSERFTGATVFDVDHDLHQDIVICDGAIPTPCRALYGDGAGNFGELPDAANDRIGSNLVHFADADIDLDGVMDTVGVSRNDNRVVVLFGSAGSNEVTPVELGVSIKPIVVAASDMNGDGIPDIVVTNEGTHDISRYIQGQGSASPLRGNRSFSGVRVATGGVRPLDATLADLDGQAPLDVIVSLETLDADDLAGPAGVVLFRTQGTFLIKTASIPTGARPLAVAAGLLNDDAVVDIVTSNHDDDTLTVLLSTGVNAYDPVTLDSGGLRPTDIILGDVNDDGDLDLVTVNEQSANIVVFLGDGLGGFGAPISTTPLGRERPWNVCLGDFDGDEHVDLALASVQTTDISILGGHGDGTWRDDGRVFSFPQNPTGLVCRAVDGDSLTDVRFPRRDTGRVESILTATP